MTDPPPIMQDGGAVTIRGAPLLAATYRCVLAGIARRRRDGLPSHDLQQLARELRRTHEVAMSLQRQKLAAGAADQPRWDHQQTRDDWCTTGEAAILLGLSRRSVQRMAKDPGGLDAIRVGRTYLLRSAPLLALAERRDHDRTDGVSVELGSARSTVAGADTR